MPLLSTTTFTLATYAKGDENAEKLALVLPGRLDTKDYLHMRSHVDFLATKGYFALSFDPPGTWESPGGIGLYTMTNYLKAINELIEHFGNRPTLLMGHSRGGSIGMLVGSTNPHVTGFISVFSHASPSKPEGPASSLRDIPGHPGQKRQFNLPNSFFIDSASHDIMGPLKTCTKPKLFFLGTQDIMVPPEKVQKAYDDAAEPKQLETLDSGHDYRNRPEIIEEVNRKVGEWMEKTKKHPT